MPNPNSRTTRLRRWLVARLEPHPDRGEAWCLNCELNGGRTKVLSADGTGRHATEHADVVRAMTGPLTRPIKVTIQTRWGIQ